MVCVTGLWMFQNATSPTLYHATPRLGPHFLPTNGSIWFTQGLRYSLYSPYVTAAKIKMLDASQASSAPQLSPWSPISISLGSLAKCFSGSGVGSPGKASRAELFL